MKKTLRRIFITVVICQLLVGVLFWDKPVRAQSIYVSAKSAIIMEQDTGRILYAKDANTKRKIASITKIMTAIIAIESGDMDQKVLITPEMVRTEGSSVYLQVGEKIKLRDLVYGLMLRSGNDAAQAIAISVGGSIPGFVHMMNEKAAWIGMDNTSFTNPHGLDDGDKHVSTAKDMAELMRYAMNNPEFRKITGAKSHTASSSEGSWDRLWQNKNKLVTGLYEYATGGKTGFTKKAGRTLVSTAKKDQMSLVAVTIDAPNDWNDHKTMFDTVFKHYRLHHFASVGMLDDIDNKFYKNHLFLGSNLVYPVTNSEISQLRMEYQLTEPAEAWTDKSKIPDVVGEVKLYHGETLVSSKPIYYVKKPVKDKFSKTFTNLFSIFIGGNLNG